MKMLSSFRFIVRSVKSGILTGLLAGMSLFSFTVSAPRPGQIQVSAVPHVAGHYMPEFAFDKPTNLDAWENQKKGLNASFASIDELYLRSEVPQVKEISLFQKTAWRGER